MTLTIHPEAFRVFALFTGTAWLAGFLASYLVRWIGSFKFESLAWISDVVKLGLGPITGFAAAILISNALGWLSLRATTWQYLMAATGVCVAIPAAFLTTIALSVLLSLPFSNDSHPLYRVAAVVAFGAGSSVFALFLGYSLRIITGVWDWWLLCAMYVVTWGAIVAPVPWDRLVLSVLSGLVGLWLLRVPAGG